MADPVVEFYDRLSLEYRDNMGWDWDAAVREEGASLRPSGTRPPPPDGVFTWYCTHGLRSRDRKGWGRR